MMAVTTYTFGDAKVTVQFVNPANWFERWRMRHFPEWVKRLWPIRHTMETEVTFQEFKMEVFRSLVTTTMYFEGREKNA